MDRDRLAPLARCVACGWVAAADDPDRLRRAAVGHADEHRHPIVIQGVGMRSEMIGRAA